MRHSTFKAILIFLFILTGLFGQNLSIQGVARDNTGQSLSDGDYTFDFYLYTSATGGTSVWSENQLLSVRNGVFSAVLGDIESMHELDFDHEYWLSLAINSNEELDPRTKLILSPYAIMAGISAENVVPQSGNVGLGTTSPDFPLDFGNSGGVKMEMNPGTTVNNPGIFAGWRHHSLLMGSFLEGSSSHGFISTGVGGSRRFSIGTATDADGNLAEFKPRLTVEANGSVGIGIADPITPLHVYKENASVRATFERTNDTHEAFLQFRTGGINKALFGFDNDMDDLSIYTYDGGGRIITFDSQTGDVGIGDHTPDAKLDVNGDLMINSWANQNLAANGYVQMGGLIMQWGVFECTLDNTQTESFPIAFPNACFGVYANRKEANIASPITANSWNTTSFTVNRDDGISGSETVNWFAIGN